MTIAALTRAVPKLSKNRFAFSTLGRVGETIVFPREHPGLDYKFNWSLNADGVTPTKKSAFRLMAGKEFDLKLAGLNIPKQKKIKASVASKMPEAGTAELSFDEFDFALQAAKDSLSNAENLYVPEGHASGSDVGVRVICNDPDLAANVSTSLLDRMPKKDPESLRITIYVVKSEGEEFSGYAIEEEDGQSVSAVAIMSKNPVEGLVATGIDLSLAAFEADAAAAAAEATE